MYVNNWAVFLTRQKSQKTLDFFSFYCTLMCVVLCLTSFIHARQPQVDPASFTVFLCRELFLLVYFAFKWRRIFIIAHIMRNVHIRHNTMSCMKIMKRLFSPAFGRRLDIVEEFFLWTFKFFLFFAFRDFLLKTNLIKSTKLTFFVAASSFNDVVAYVCNTKKLFYTFYACTSLNEELNRISISVEKIHFLGVLSFLFPQPLTRWFLIQSV